MIKVKLLCNWCTSIELCREWSHMYNGNNIMITHEDDADYFVIINMPLDNDQYYIPKKTIVFQMEPWCYSENQNWGVKVWGYWSKPDENVFLQVRTHEKYLNNAIWQMPITYYEFKTIPIIKENRLDTTLSTICSSKYFDPGHIKRVDFLKFLEQKHMNLNLHIYGNSNDHEFKNYMGALDMTEKQLGMWPYKYYFMAENNAEYNFITEKLWEPILCECLCFYWGCPNVNDYIDERAFIKLDLDNLEESYDIIVSAISGNEWEKRLEIIRNEKQKILDKYQFFPLLEDIITNINKEN